MNPKQNFWIRWLAPLFLALFLAFLMYMLAQFRESPGFAWYGLFWFFGTILLLWESGWIISKRLDQYVTWNDKLFKRLGLQLLSTNLVGISIFIITFILLNSYENFVLLKNNPLSLFHLMVSSAFAFIFIQIINSVQISYLILENYQQTQIESENLRKENAISAIEKIQSHLHGDAIFGQLAELESMIEQSPEKSKHYLQNLTVDYQSNFNKLHQQLVGIQESLLTSTEQHPSLHSETVDISLNDSYKTRFLVRSGQKMTVVPIDQIAGFYKDDLVLLLTVKGKKYVIDRSLEELSKRLSPAKFFRINRQCIINLEAIIEGRVEGSQLALSTVVDFPKSLYVSQRNTARFKKWWDGE